MIDKLRSAIISMFVLLSVFTSCTTEKETLPNIVFIMADDLGFGDISCYNPESKIQTPNIDKLHSEGVHFTDAHTQSAVCTPSRYGLLTGRYCLRTHLKRNVLNGFPKPLIEKERITVAQILKNAGYTTACIGKWHLGVGWQTKNNKTYKNDVPVNEVNFSKTFTDSPNDHGFDYSFITSACSTVDPPYVFIENGKCTALLTEKMENNAPVVTFGSRPGPMVPNWSNENVDPTFVQKSEAFIDRTLKSDKKNPFFLYLALSAPHAPWLPPDFVKGKSNEGHRGDLVVLLDWCVGQISKILDERGITENTLVIFTSDNGPRICKNGHQSAGKLKGYKSHIWEGGHRVPFIAKWPDKIAPNSSSSELICLTDMLRTLGDVANADIPENAGQDSYNVLPAILGENYSGPIREATIHHSFWGVFSLRKDHWKLIIGSKGSGGWVSPFDGTVTNEIHPDVGQLYNLKDDPYEQNDLWEKRPDKVKELKGILEKYKK